MDKLENIIPPPVLVLIIALCMYGASLLLPILPIHRAISLFAAFCSILIGGYFMLAGFRSLKRADTTINPLDPGEASSLVSSGIFQISRNPMYVGMTFLLLSWSLFLSSPYTIFGTLIFVIYINRFQIQPEERALSTLFGSEFESYRVKVRRWL
jgi:protein-S-isoprenylcysteine O-methyltransferase Ste14